ncbi:hypothetical protein [Paraburkholderia sp. DGU8]|uniref:hypothetical protein n=1 Tax=Paraburkholderia sp. DGU8 TaxID=3161997 RepID=UPI00346535A8
MKLAECHHDDEGVIMLQWIASWTVRSVPTPEKRAEKALRELRLELFQAEQRILDAQMHADYYRARLAFCESVLKSGIEQVSDQRKAPQTGTAALWTGHKLTAAQ